jgi:outer membrane protein OmpA-like peptidoglycan-associated protein
MKNSVNFLKLEAFVLSFMCVGFSFSQNDLNLVTNPSFEDVEGKQKKLGNIDKATGWNSATGKAADLFIFGEKIAELSAPTNLYGKQDPKDGKNYAGIVAYSYNNEKLQRSYIYSELSKEMTKGARYCVKFNVVLADASKYYCNNIGAFITKESVDASATQILNAGKKGGVVLHPNNKMEDFDSNFDWKQVCGTYVSTGKEKYIIIGNFSDDSETEWDKNKVKSTDYTPVAGAYYYIDNISVEPLESGASCDCMVAEKEAYSTVFYNYSPTIVDKMTTNQQIEVQKAYYKFGQSEITDDQSEALDFIVEKLKANSSLKLEINGHSDIIEDSLGVYKPELAGMSSNRVNAAINYFVSKGINESRLIGVPNDSAEPSEDILESDEEELKYAKCRRITFKVR